MKWPVQIHNVVITRTTFLAIGIRRLTLSKRLQRLDLELRSRGERVNRRCALHVPKRKRGGNHVEGDDKNVGDRTCKKAEESWPPKQKQQSQQ
jgi:hypothetical protein